MLQSLLASRGSKWIVGGWAGFMAENVVLSHNREELIAAVGKETYLKLYGLLSTVSTGAILYGYVRYGRRTDPIKMAKGSAYVVAGYFLQGCGLAGLMQFAPTFQVPVKWGGEEEIRHEDAAAGILVAPHSAALTMSVRCPIDFAADKKNLERTSSPDSLYGMERVSRHPQLWSLGIFCIGRAVPALYYPEVAFWSLPLVWAYLGGAHQDYRHRRKSGGVLTPEKDAMTSNVPFVAMLQGKQSFDLWKEETKWVNAGIGGTAALAMMALRLTRKMK